MIAVATQPVASTQQAAPGLNPGGGLLALGGVVIVLFLVIVARVKRPATKQVPLVTLPADAATTAIVAVPVPAAPTRPLDANAVALTLLTGGTLPHDLEGRDDPLYEGEAAMGQIADAWKGIKQRYAAAIEAAKKATEALAVKERENQALRDERDQLAQTRDGLMQQVQQLQEQLAAAPSIDQADQAALDELLGKKNGPAVDKSANNTSAEGAGG